MAKYRDEKNLYKKKTPMKTPLGCCVGWKIILGRKRNMGGSAFQGVGEVDPRWRLLTLEHWGT